MASHELYRAADNGDAELVASLLAQGVSPESKSWSASFLGQWWWHHSAGPDAA